MKWLDDLKNVIERSVAYGWHERNAGNISMRLRDEDIVSLNLREGEDVPLGMTVVNLRNKAFIITGTGKHFRNVLRDFEDSVCLFRINEKGDGYRVLWGNAKPSSELPTHLLCHDENDKLNHHVIMHAHTTNLIALSFVLPLNTKAFTEKLWAMNTECPIVFPEGVGVLEWMVPGTIEIGKKTQALMKEYRAVIWAHHGVFCSGTDLDETFGLMETLEKSAEVLVKVMSMGGAMNTIQSAQLERAAQAFNVTLKKLEPSDKTDNKGEVI